MTAPTSSAAFDPYDPAGLDASLDTEERAIRESVRVLLESQVLPHIAGWWEQGEVPSARDLMQQFGQLGLLGMHLDGYGCPGLSATAYGLACLELEAADSGIRSMVSVQGSLAMTAIHHYGSVEQCEQWLPSMASGHKIGCFGLTEPDAGSDPGAMTTRAEADGSDYRLTGRKLWISNGGIADVAIVWAQTEEGIRGFIVPTETPGFSAHPIKHKMSMRASVTSELVLDDVRVPAEAVLPKARGLTGPLGCLTEARFGLIWGSMGAARSAYRAAASYSREREQFGKPIGAFQLTQAKLAEMAIEYAKGTLLAHHIGRQKDAGQVPGELISLAKLNNTRAALEICRSARTILGGNGISLEYPVIRHMNNLESVLTYEGTPEMHTLVLGQAITGHSAFRG